MIRIIRSSTRARLRADAAEAAELRHAAGTLNRLRLEASAAKFAAERETAIVRRRSTAIMLLLAARYMASTDKIRPRQVDRLEIAARLLRAAREAHPDDHPIVKDADRLAMEVIRDSTITEWHAWSARDAAVLSAARPETAAQHIPPAAENATPDGSAPIRSRQVARLEMAAGDLHKFRKLYPDWHPAVKAAMDVVCMYLRDTTPAEFAEWLRRDRHDIARQFTGYHLAHYLTRESGISLPADKYAPCAEEIEDPPVHRDRESPVSTSVPDGPGSRQAQGADR